MFFHKNYFVCDAKVIATLPMKDLGEKTENKEVMPLMVSTSLFLFFLSFSAFSQSKKEQIKRLKKSYDSLQVVVIEKDNEVLRLKNELNTTRAQYQGDLTLLRNRIAELEKELSDLRSKELVKNISTKKSKKQPKEQKALQLELAKAKKQLDSIKGSSDFFKTGKQMLFKQLNRPDIQLVDNPLCNL